VPNRELELPSAEMRLLIAEAMDRIVRYIETLPERAAADTEGSAEVARSLREPLPLKGEPFADLLDLVFTKALPKGFGTAGPGYLAYIPGGGLFQSAVADLISDSLNRYVGVWAAAPGLVQLEANVVSWFCEIVGYPKGSGGFFTTGGSLSNFSAVVTARRERLPEDFLKGILYTSDQTHHSVQKAALLAGFPPGNVRAIPADEKFRIRMDLLREEIARDRAAGFTPFLVVGNAGTTNTGAVDDLEALADLCAGESLWLHVDGAYGGFFMLTERGRAAMKGISRADSITLDPHKGLFLPYGTGSLLVRDASTLGRAHGMDAHYLPSRPDEADDDLVDFSHISPELSRAFRGLRVWLPFKLHGIGPFRENLDEKLDLALWATEELRKIPGIRIVAAPQLSLVVFQLERPGATPADIDRLTRSLLAGVNARNRVHITGTQLDGRFVARICVLSFRTHAERMEQGLEDIRLVAVALSA
jgi:aromatic-L-amino-acid/L-tryptophan decarboxylase